MTIFQGRSKLLFTVLKFAVLLLLDPLPFMLFRLMASDYAACGRPTSGDV